MALNGMNKAEETKLNRLVAKLMKDPRVLHLNNPHRPLPEGEYQILTKAGTLWIKPSEGAIFCRFEDGRFASQILYGRQVGLQEARLNPYSGKWNFHWFKPKPIRGVKPGQPLTAAFAFAEFQREMEPLLTLRTATEQEADALAAENGRELIDGAFRILDGTEWDSDTTSSLSCLLQDHGMRIPRDPNEIEEEEAEG